MGMVHAEIELVNSDDLGYFERGDLNPNEVRRERVVALVDSGAYMLCINENIREQLGLLKEGDKLVELADGNLQKVDMVGPVKVCFENRMTTVDALVLPGNSEVLLGAIPMEGLDVIIDPLEQTLKLPPDRPYLARTIVK